MNEKKRNKNSVKYSNREAFELIDVRFELIRRSRIPNTSMSEVIQGFR